MASEDDDGGSEKAARRAVNIDEFREEIKRAKDQRSCVDSLNLRQLDLKQLDDVTEITIKNCDFSGADMTGLTFAGVTFSGCLFQQTVLNNANLIGSCFVNECVLHLAELRHAEAHDACFLRATMTAVDATGANFQNSDFKGTSLQNGNFNLADLRRVKNFVPDETKMRGTLLSIQDEDPWSALRRIYTGPRLLLNMLPVAIFAATLAVKTYGLYLLAVIEDIAGAREGLAAYCQNAEVNCETWTVLEIVAGFSEGFWAVVFVFFSLGYNVLRFFLTSVVSRLREHEDRTGISPSCKGRGSYEIPQIAHCVLRILRIVMLCLFAYSFYGILAAKVTLVA